MNRIKVLFVASECYPFVKVGGLGDVISSLTKNLADLGVEIKICLPKYESIGIKEFNLKKVTEFKTDDEKITVFEGKLNEKISVFFLENPTFLSRGEIYSNFDDFKGFERFLFFSKVVPETLQLIGWIPDIIHCHEWHTAILPLLLSLKKERITTILTIHNLAVQGKWKDRDIFNFLKLKGNETETLRIRDREGNFNLLQQGIINANLVTTVSPTYSKEILTKKFGEGLEEWLRQKKPIGILNGIDTEVFNPETDPHLKKKYSLLNFDGKIENKIELQKILKFEKNPSIFLGGFIGRLTPQKGVELFQDIIEKLVKLKLQIVFLGVGNKKYEEILLYFAKKYPENISAQIKFDLSLAQKIYGGCDAIFVPSLFEPCGLVQMIAQRYGTLPIARKTGGLKDTIEDGKTGFLFEKYSPFAFLRAIKKALFVFRDKKTWQKMMKRAMKKDFSWKKSAKKYLKLYERLLLTNKGKNAI